jgi:hypothetical protein
MTNTVIQALNAGDPVKQLYTSEYSHYFLCFCSFICLINNKKLNLANIFLCLLKSKENREVFKMLCDIQTDYGALKKFLQYEPSLHKSKYIKNYLEQGNILDRLEK